MSTSNASSQNGSAELIRVLNLGRALNGARSRLACKHNGRRMVDQQDRHDALAKMTARMRWACDTPRRLEGLGLRLRESRTLAQTPRAIRARLGYRQLLLWTVAALNLRDFANYRVNLFHAAPDA